MMAATSGISAHPDSPRCVELIQNICKAAAQYLNTATLQIAVFSWEWILACAPHLRVNPLFMAQ